MSNYTKVAESYNKVFVAMAAQRSRPDIAAGMTIQQMDDVVGIIMSGNITTKVAESYNSSLPHRHFRNVET